jgi:hypothetical protein
MPVVRPPSTRCVFEDTADSLRIIIPSRRHWLRVASLGFQILFWGFGEIIIGWMVLSALNDVLSGTLQEGFCAIREAAYGSLFMLVLLAVWTVVGAFGFYVLSWQFAGREVIELSDQSLKVRREVMGIGRTKEYMAEYAKDLRVSPIGYVRGWSMQMRKWGIGGGRIAFDYGAKTFRFGDEIDEAEGKQVLAAIQQRYPQYCADRG